MRIVYEFFNLRWLEEVWLFEIGVIKKFWIIIWMLGFEFVLSVRVYNFWFLKVIFIKYV